MLVLIEENKEEVIKMLKVIKVIYFGEICLVIKFRKFFLLFSVFSRINDIFVLSHFAIVFLIPILKLLGKNQRNEEINDLC